MNPQRAQLMGELEGRKQKKMSLVVAGKSHIDAIKDKLVRSSIEPLEKIDAQGILYNAQELKKIQTEHKQILEEIVKLTEELE